PPYGYLRDNNLKLYPDPEKSWVIPKIFELMANGIGRQAIAQELDRLGIAPPEGEYWNPSTISSIIKNEVYLGHIIWGKIRYTKQNGKYIRKKVSKERWQRHDNAHPPLVSEELFQKANTAHSKRWRPPTIKTKKLSNPLAGILLCELCGHSMLYQPRKDRPNPQVRCVQPSCKGVQKGASLALVEQRILDGLKQIIESFEIQENMVQQKKRKNNIHLQQKALEKKEQQMNNLQKQKSNLHDFLEKGVYDVDTFLERQKSIAVRLKTTQKAIEELKHEIKKILEKEKHIHEFVPRIKNVLEAYYATNDIEKKNHLLKSVLEKVTYLRKKEWKRKDEFIMELHTKI
ncbi:recombinase family protein, partial [Bacillus cytotoxicus]